MLVHVKKKYTEINWLAVMVVVLLSYGFLLANQIIGIDDENIDFYYKYNGIVAAGRWASWVLYKIVNTYDYLPVWREMLAIIILVSAAVIFICIYEYVAQISLDNFISTAGVCLIVSYPLLAKMFSYIGGCVETALCVLLAALSYYIYIYPFKNKYLKYLSIVTMQVVGIGLLEVIAVYFCVEICLFGFLNKNEKNLLKLVFKPVGILAVSVVLSKIMARLVAAHLAGFGISYTSYSTGWFIKWNTIKSTGDLLQVFQEFAANFRYYAQKYFSIKIFLAACLVWFMVGVYKIIKKEFVNALLAVGIIAASFSLLAVSANASLPLRTYTSNFVAVTGIIIYLYFCLKEWKFKGKYSLKYLVPIIVFFTVLYNTKEANQFYQTDYKRYIRDADVARNVNYDLQKTLKKTKPDKAVVFLGTPEQYGDILTEGEVCLDTIYAGNQTGNSIRIHRFFSMLGYEYPTVLGRPVGTYFDYYEFLDNENTVKALDAAADMPSYPEEGYISEQDEIIIIKLGEIN